LTEVTPPVLVPGTCRRPVLGEVAASRARGASSFSMCFGVRAKRAVCRTGARDGMVSALLTRTELCTIEKCRWTGRHRRARNLGGGEHAAWRRARPEPTRLGAVIPNRSTRPSRRATRLEATTSWTRATDTPHFSNGAIFVTWRSLPSDTRATSRLLRPANLSCRTSVGVALR
jgi:hypothetical protein